MRYLIVLLFLSLGPSSALAQERVEEPTTQPSSDFERFVERQASLEIQIGLKLYQEYDDYRAITALRRYAILEDSDSARFLTSLMIGQIYHRNEEAALAVVSFERAVGWAEDPSTKSWAYLMALQEMCLPLAYYWECRRRLQQLGQQPLLPRARDLVDYQTLYTDVVLRSEYVIEKRAELFEDPRLRDRARGLVAQDRAFEELDLQSPALAGALSAVLPGSGQLYNGRPIDAAISLVVNGLFGLATWYSFAELESIPAGVVSGIFAAGFYGGNIINAVSDAKQINAKRYLGFFEELKLDYWPRVHFDIADDVVTFGYSFDWPGPTLESETRRWMDEQETLASPEGEALPNAPSPTIH